MTLEAFLSVLAILLGIVGTNLIVLGVRLFRGSRDAYEMNRAVTGSSIRAAKGQLLDDGVDGQLLVEHGVAFEVDRASEKGQCKYLKQSKLSTDSVFEALK